MLLSLAVLSPCLLGVSTGLAAGQQVYEEDSKTMSLLSSKPDGHPCDAGAAGGYYPWAPPSGAGYVDIDDVAAAHTLAMVTPSASGR